MYEQYKWCNRTGGPGSGWHAEWGDLSPVVAESCCACGKKTQNTGTRSLIHLTRVECRCQHLKTKQKQAVTAPSNSQDVGQPLLWRISRLVVPLRQLQGKDPKLHSPETRVPHHHVSTEAPANRRFAGIYLALVETRSKTRNTIARVLKTTPGRRVRSIVGVDDSVTEVSVTAL